MECLRRVFPRIGMIHLTTVTAFQPSPPFLLQNVHHSTKISAWFKSLAEDGIAADEMPPDEAQQRRPALRKSRSLDSVIHRTHVTEVRDINAADSQHVLPTTMNGKRLPEEQLHSLDNFKEELQSHTVETQLPPIPANEDGQVLDYSHFAFDDSSAVTESDSDQTSANNDGVDLFNISDDPCERCSSISIESAMAEVDCGNLEQSEGFYHSTILELRKSTCPVCTQIWHSIWLSGDRKYEGTEYSEARVHLVIRPCYVTEDNRSLDHDHLSVPSWKRPSANLWLTIHLCSGCPGSENAIDLGETCGVKCGEPLKSISCFTDEHDPAIQAGIPWLRKVGPATGSPYSLSIAKDWLTSCLECDNTQPEKSIYLGEQEYRLPKTDYDHNWTLEEITHQGQAESLPEEVPARLIYIRAIREQGDIGTRKTQQDVWDIKLINTGDQVKRYACLSYCWGKAQEGDNRDWRTTSSTINRHLAGIDRKGLPKTLRDAIRITACLGLSYLWVDSLCIIQDSKDDWDRESAKMGGIYLASALTIAASVSVSAEEGMLRAHSSPALPPEAAGYGLSYEGSHTIVATLRDGHQSRLHLGIGFTQPPTSSWANEVEESQLCKRAWTYQEHNLPRRLLFIGSTQLFWQCHHCRLREDRFPEDPRPDLFSTLSLAHPLSRQEIASFWYGKIVTEYSQRSLTNASDKMTAISSLARAIYLNHHVDYIAGVWKDSIVLGIGWWRVGAGNKRQRKLDDGAFPPTWSWASQNSPVFFGWPWSSSRDPTQFTPRVVDAHSEAVKSNPFGDVVTAYIVLDTAVTLGFVKGSRLLTVDKSDFGLAEGDPYCNGPIMDDEEDHRDSEARPVLVALLRQDRLWLRKGYVRFALLLEPAMVDAKEHYRVGMAMIQYGSDSEYEIACGFPAGWTRSTVKLI